MTTRINLSKNPSFETGITGYTNSAGTIAWDTTYPAMFGTGTLKATMSTSGRFAIYGSTAAIAANADSIPVTAGEQVTFSAYVKRASGDWYFQYSIIWFNSSGAFLSDYTPTSPQVGSSWYRLSGTATAPAGAASFGVMISSSDGNPHTVYTDGWLIEKSGTLGAYFDGSTTNLPGWDQAWTGTAHASTSTSTSNGATVRTNYFKQPSLESVLPSANNLTQSISTTTGVIAGTGSLALAATGASNDSYAETNAPGTLYSGVATGGLVAGQTYTISAYVTLTAPLGGTLHGRALRIDVFTKVSGGGYVETMTSQAPNVAGTTRVSGQFTVPTGVTELFIRFYNGGTSGTVYWDGVLIEAGTTLGNYFDGSMVTAGYARAWTGTVNDSTSQEAPTTTKVTLKNRESGAWVSRTAVPKVYVNGAWVIKRPKRWNSSTSTWVDLP